LYATARDLVEALRPLTDLPLLLGVGIGTPDQAAEACAFADGVVVGSALMARVVAGDQDGAIELARTFRAAIPTGETASPAAAGRV
jgi:tryptophan synthase alpha chain